MSRLAELVAKKVEAFSLSLSLVAGCCTELTRRKINIILQTENGFICAALGSEKEESSADRRTDSLDGAMLLV